MLVLCAFIRRRHWVRLPLKLLHLIIQQASIREAFSFKLQIIKCMFEK